MSVFLAAAAVSLALAASAGGASADASYSDPAGDQDGVAAVDITTVLVSNTSNAVTFRITIRNPEVTASSFQFLVFVDFDIDKNPATGVDGHEARVIWERSFGLTFQRSSGDEVVDAPTTGMSASFSGGTLTLTMPLTALDSVASFGFQIGAINVSAPPGGGDIAPHLGRAWVYDITVLLTLTASKPMGSPARPVAGRPFTVSTVVRRSDTGSTVISGSVTCTVRVGAARIRAAARFVGGKPRCVMTVPKDAKGKTLAGTIAVRALGTSVKKPFNFRVV